MNSRWRCIAALGLALAWALFTSVGGPLWPSPLPQPGPPKPVANLVCSEVDPIECTFTALWQNMDPYDSIRVLLDGNEVIVLSGTAGNTFLSLPGIGVFELCVIAERNGIPSEPVCCWVECAADSPAPVANLDCRVADPAQCRVKVLWQNLENYDNVLVFVDGIISALLPGSAGSSVLTLPSGAPVEICVVPRRNGITGEATCCRIECPLAPAAVADLSCLVVDPVSCEVQATWKNPEDYDDILVLLQGGVIAMISGTATEFTTFLPEPGDFELCVIPVRGDVAGEPSCCGVKCIGAPVLPPRRIACQVISADPCAVAVTWQNQAAYSLIQISVDGSIVDTVPGDVETAEVSVPSISVVHEICLIAETPRGDVLRPTCCEVQCENDFVRGDCNTDGEDDLGDPVFIMRFLFQGIPPGRCPDACDANDDGLIDTSDVTYLVLYMLDGGRPPLSPFPLCGFDSTPDDLGCDRFDACP